MHFDRKKHNSMDGMVTSACFSMIQVFRQLCNTGLIEISNQRIASPYSVALVPGVGHL